MRVRSALLVALFVAGFAQALPAAAAPVQCTASPCVIRVVGGRYDPPDLRVPLGATVQWLVQENGHTISASDYRFDWEPNSTLRAGDTRSWTFTADETVRYSCRIHAPGMSGIITVGQGSPPPPPSPEITGETRQVPSLMYPTVAAAMISIPPDSEIVLAPGTYPPFKVLVEDVLIRSATSPEAVVVDGSVVVDGGGISKTGITIAANRVRVRGLRVVKVADHAVRVDADDAQLSYLDLASGLLSAVRVSGRRARIEDSIITGSIAAPGIDLVGGDDVLVRRVTVSGARAGLRAIGTDGVVVRNSTFAGGGSGIVIRSSPTDRVLGGHLFSNKVLRTNGPTLGLGADLDPVTGAGIWLDSTWGVRVERNTIEDSMTYAVAVTGAGGPTVDAFVSQTTASGSRIADVGWDGLGTACITHEGTTDPPLVLPCSGRATPGVPYPRVLAELLLYAAVGQLL